jgi:hypothetical protein
VRWSIPVLLLGASTAVADPKPDGWPSEGRCVASADAKRRCALRITVRDATAIREAMLAWLSPDRLRATPTLHRARSLAEGPISANRIGGYHLVTVRRVDNQDELMMSASAGGHRSFSAVLRPTRSGWTVVGITTFSRHPRR